MGIAFLKPTKSKLIFLIQWAFFIPIELVRGNLETRHHLLVAAYPLIFFYLVACALVALAQRVQQIGQGWRLFLFAFGLIVFDQLLKTLVAAFVPYQASFPIIKQWLHVAHMRNYEGSWFTSAFEVTHVGLFYGIQWGLALLVLLFAALIHRYYITTHRRSLWADVAFLGNFAACASWLLDMTFRGYVLDYINLPGLVTADFKDILITLGAAAFFVESVDNPAISWKWRGWRKEMEALIQLLKDLYLFSINQEHKP